MAKAHSNMERIGASRDVLWRSLDGFGFDHSRAIIDANGVLMFGTIITALDEEPVTITYYVECDPEWRTYEVVVTLLRANGQRSDMLHLEADGEGNWTQVIETANQIATRKLRQLDGCIDIDLAFSPVTNTLLIRRYALEAGESADVTAAWIQFPSMKIEKLPQRYTRTGLSTYRYESLSPSFSADLEVDSFGLVRTYAGLWERVAEATERH